VVLFLDSLNLQLYNQAIEDGHFNDIESLFENEEDRNRYRWKCQGPGYEDRIYHCFSALLNCPISNTQRKKLRKESKQNGQNHSQYTDEDFLLTLNQLHENHFPISHRSRNNPSPPSEELHKYSLFIELDRETSDYTPGLPLVAIDCEMCRTHVGLELTRISIIDDEENIIYDELVKPSNPIVDYLTEFSGITESDLAKVDTELSDVQQILKKWLTQSTIIVGHSLENDLMAMKLIHQRVIDTSVLFPNRNSKHSLKYLCSRYLKVSIQISSHDSVQDATAALRLYKLKKENGPSFGIDHHEMECLFDMLTRYQKKSAYIDNIHNIKQFGGLCASLLPVSNDQEVVSKTLSQMKNKTMNLVVSRLAGMAECLDSNEKIFQQMNINISRILQGVPPNGLLIVFSGPGHLPKEDQSGNYSQRLGFGLFKMTK